MSISLKNCKTLFGWLSFIIFMMSALSASAVQLNYAIEMSVNQDGTANVIKFTPTITDGTKPYAFAWDFGDGSTSTEEAPTHIYTKAGNYTVSLDFTDGTGTNLTGTNKITIPIFVGVIWKLSTYNADDSFTYDFDTKIAGATPPYTYTWDFGDGEISTDPTPSHTYTTSGTFNFSVNVTNSTGLTGSSDSVIVLPIPVTEDLSWIPTFNADGTVSVAFTSKIIHGTQPYNYTWDFGDGSTSTEPNPTHQYSSTGSYTFSLKISDSTGLEGLGKTGTIELSAPTYQLVVDSSITDAVSIAPLKNIYQHGESVTLTINNNTCASFTGWSGNCSGTTPTCTLTMDTPKSVTASFSTPHYQMNKTAQNGTIITTPEKETYSCDSQVELQAVPDSGYRFVSWQGDVTGSTITNTVTMDANKNVTAIFEPTTPPPPNTYLLTPITVGSGSITLNPKTGPYNEGQLVTATAKPDACQMFTNWDNDCVSKTADTCTVKMDSNQTLTANFKAKTFTLQKNAQNGSIETTPNSVVYDCGSQIQLKATADLGYQFVRWEGAVSGTQTTTNLLIDNDKSVTAIFESSPPNSYTLNRQALGMGTINVEPEKTAYNEGEPVILTAVAGQCGIFAHWKGDCSGSATSCALTMNSHKTVTAQFNEITYNLDVTQPKGGQIKLEPPGDIHDCGTQVQLQAVAEPNYQFVRWEGTISGTQTTTTLIMDSNKTITARFESVAKPSYILNTEIQGNGKVNVQPEKTTYDEGDKVILTAIAENDCSLFSSWSGHCTGSSNSCSLTIDSDKNVSAKFSTKTFQLNATPSQGGKITVEPPSKTYDCGTQVELNAIADERYRFVYWEEYATGSETPLMLTMDSDKNVTALFTQVSDSNAVEYIYDELHRLVQVSYPQGPTIYYAYDEVGNLLSATESPIYPLPIPIEEPQRPTVEILLNQSSYTVGHTIKLDIKVQGHGIVDLYVAFLDTKGGIYAFMPSNEQPIPPVQYLPWKKDVQLKGNETIHIMQYQVQSDLPTGDYSVCAALVEPGALLTNLYSFNLENWLHYQCIPAKIY